MVKMKRLANIRNFLHNNIFTHAGEQSKLIAPHLGKFGHLLGKLLHIQAFCCKQVKQIKSAKLLFFSEILFLVFKLWYDGNFILEGVFRACDKHKDWNCENLCRENWHSYKVFSFSDWHVKMYGGIHWLVPFTNKCQRKREN